MRDNYMFSLVTDEYEQENDFLLKYFPDVKIKYKDNNLAFAGNVFNYEDLSKVRVFFDESKNYIVEPLIFATDRTKNGKVLDFMGIYAIGVIEILFLNILKQLDSINEFTKEFNKTLNIFETYKNVQDTYNIINLSNECDENKEYLEIFNILFAMKSDYSKMGSQITRQYINILSIIWLQDKRKFWQIFFDIMKLSRPLYSAVLDTEIQNEFIQDILKDYEDFDGEISVAFSNDITKWLKKEDLDFSKIEYTVPNSDEIKYITNCRGFSICLAFKFYLQILNKYGHMNSKVIPLFDYTNESYINYLDEQINNSFGNDSCSKVLRGIKIKALITTDFRGSYIWNVDNMKYNYRIKDTHVTRDYYEDYVLFLRSKLNLNISDAPEFCYNDICVNYSNIDCLQNAISYILYHCSENVFAVDLSAIADYAKESQNYIQQLERTIVKLKNEILDIKDDYISLDHYNNVLEELKQKNDLLDSKTNIIEQLNKENKELNMFISNIYGSDEDLEDDEVELEVSIEEMIKVLNEFKFCMIGGRMELLSKLEQYGWTNLIQYDNRKMSKVGSVTSADFYVVNTKFISHTLVATVEKNVDLKDIMLYYNGTNTTQLIKSCYEFVQKFFKE